MNSSPSPGPWGVNRGSADEDEIIPGDRGRGRGLALLRVRDRRFPQPFAAFEIIGEHPSVLRAAEHAPVEIGDAAVDRLRRRRRKGSMCSTMSGRRRTCRCSTAGRICTLCGEDKRGHKDIKACMQFDRDRDPTMSESNRSPRLSNRSLQVASTLSTEDEILRSETLVEFAREVSDFGVSDARSLSQRPAKSRKCRGPSARLKTCRKQEVSLVEPDGSSISAPRSYIKQRLSRC